MGKIKHYTKLAILLLSVFTVQYLIVTKLFEVSDYDDLSIPYALAGTILTIYLYGKRR